MSSFIVRIEMHQVGFDYALLHDQMNALGFTRRIKADDGTLYELPTAEYVIFLKGDVTAVSVRDYVCKSLDGRGWSYWVLATRYDQTAWKLVPSNSANSLMALVSSLR